MNKLVPLKNTKGKDPHTIYQNHDKELLEKLKNYPKSNSFNYMFGEKWLVEDFTPDENGDLKCVFGKNIKYLPKKDVLEYLNDERADKIHKEFEIETEFTKQYGNLYSHESGVTDDYGYDYKKYKRVYSHTHILKFKHQKESFLDKTCTYDERQIDLSFFRSQLSLTLKKTGNFGFMQFDEDGNFINRDYNINLNHYNGVIVDKDKIYQDLLTHLKSLGNFQYSEKTKYFYRDEFMIIPYDSFDSFDEKWYEYNFRLNVIEKQNEEFYKTRGEPRFKKPKVLVEKTNAEFIELLTPYLDKIKQRLDEIFDIDN